MQLTPNLKLKKPEASDAVNIVDLNDNADALDSELSSLFTSLSDKVDKVAGKGLSTNDYTTAEKTKLSGIATGAQVNPGAATTSAAGLMSAADKSKLDGVATGANNYTHPSSHPPSIITQDASNRFVTDAEKATWNAKASTAVATGAANGLMPAADKAALNAATNAATASTLVKRDSAGRMKAAAPSASDDVARKAETDTLATNLAGVNSHVNAISVVEPGPGREARLVSEVSWDTIDVGGFYRGTQMLNRPTYSPAYNSVPWEYGEVIRHNADWIIQRVTNFSNTETYQRIRADGVWMEWKPVRVDEEPQIRVSGGQLQFLDGGVWKAVGANQVAMPSNTVQYQDNTTRTLSTNGEMIIGRFITKARGIIRVKFELNTGMVSSSNNVTPYLRSLYFQGSESTGTAAGAAFGSQQGRPGYDWDLPLGSLQPPTNYNRWAINSTRYGGLLTGGAWTTYDYEFAVSDALPYIITASVGTPQSPFPAIRNLQVLYDVITP